MKTIIRIILILLTIVISSCSSYTLTKDFFKAYSYGEIDDIDTTNVYFNKHTNDEWVPALGSIIVTETNLRLKYKTSKRYRVDITGRHKLYVCKDSLCHIEHIDSLYLTGIAIVGGHSTAIIFRKSDDRQEIKSPIPLKILKKLREDFVRINKLTHYNLGMEKRENWNFTYPYLLYERKNE